MARGRQVVYSSSSSDDMDVSEEVEVSEEERSPSPQLVRGRPGEGTSRGAEASVFDSARFSTLRNQEWHEAHANLEFLFEMHVSPGVEIVYRISEASINLVGRQFSPCQFTTTLTWCTSSAATLIIKRATVVRWWSHGCVGDMLSCRGSA